MDTASVSGLRRGAEVLEKVYESRRNEGTVHRLVTAVDNNCITTLPDLPSATLPSSFCSPLPLTPISLPVSLPFPTQPYLSLPFTFDLWARGDYNSASSCHSEIPSVASRVAASTQGHWLVPRLGLPIPLSLPLCCLGVVGKCDGVKWGCGRAGRCLEITGGGVLQGNGEFCC